MDTLNPTGYAQVLDELQGGAVAAATLGACNLSASRNRQTLRHPRSPWTTSYYGFDGHGSVRYLTDSTGAVTDTYDYDAFGNLINSDRHDAEQLPLCRRAVRSRSRPLLQPRPIPRRTRGPVLGYGYIRRETFTIRSPCISMFMPAQIRSIVPTPAATTTWLTWAYRWPSTRR